MVLGNQELVDLFYGCISPEAKVFLRGDQDGQVERWTTYGAPSSVATVKPATVSDIQNIVRCATANGIPFLATASGHGYSTSFEKAKNLLLVDISYLKDISIDETANTVTIGGAVLFSELVAPLYEAGKEMPLGGCSSTGVVGVTLGGGVARYQGLDGLLIDSLLSVVMVTSNGDLITASKNENSELFWGIRGAGFNFGIVVSATYKMVDQRNGGQVMNADLVFPATSNLAIWEILKDLDRDQPPELPVVVVANYNEELGGANLLVNIVHPGSIESGMALIKPFTDLKPLVEKISTIPWNQIYTTWGFGIDAGLSIKGLRRNLYTAGLKQIDVPTFASYFNQMATMYENFPAARQSALLIEKFSTKAVREVGDEDTAFPHRDIKTHLLILTMTTDPSLEEVLDRMALEARSRFQASSGFDEPRTYVSYGHGDEAPTTWYGKSNLTRLVALKRRWDPNGVFSFNNPIEA